MSKARELAELSRTVADSADAVAITVDSNENTTFTGVVTANAGVVVDNINIDGTTIALSSGDLTLDVAGDIILDAAGDVTINGSVTATGTSVFASLDISGDIDVDGTTNLDVVDIDGAVDFASTTAHAGNATFADNAKAIFGAGSDLQIYHDGSHSYIKDAGTGQLRLLAGTNVQIWNADATKLAANFNGDTQTSLYYAGSSKLDTTATGIDITGDATFPDNGKAIFGAGSDLQIYHDGFNSYIKDAGTGDLRIWADSPNISTASGNKIFYGNNGSAELYTSGGTLRLATTASGIDVTGSVTATGIIEASDGTNGEMQFGLGTALTTGAGTYDSSVRWNGSAGNLLFSQGAVEKMRITASGIDVTGSVTLATTATDTGVDLTLNGNKSTNGGVGSIIFENAGDSVGMIRSNRASANDAADMLFYTQAAGGANTERMRIDSAGIDVAGSVTADGLTVQGSSVGGTYITSSSGPAAGDIKIEHIINSGRNLNTINSESGSGSAIPLALATGEIERLNIASNGDISFYEDTGTTPKLFWDASAEALGIGTSSPTSTIDVRGESVFGSGTDGVKLTYSAGNSTGIIDTGFTSTGLEFRTGNSFAAIIDASGNVGIGVSAPESIVHIKDSGNVRTTLQIEGAATGYAPVINFDGIVGANADYLLGEINGSWDARTNVVSAVRFESGADTTNKDDGLISFWTSSSGPTLTERMRIDADGNVKVGSSSTQIGYWEADAVHDGYLIPYNGSGETELVNSFTSGALVFKTGTSKTEAMRIDADGDVGIGTAGSVAFSAGSGLRIERAATATLRLQDTGSHGFEIRAAAGAAEFFSANSKPFTFSGGASELMRIDALGNLLVGTTTPGEGVSFGADGITTIKGEYGAMIKSTGGSGYEALSLWNAATSGTIYQAIFRDGASGAARGTITTNGSATAYNTSSDQRLKENIVDAPSASDDIDAIQVRSFDWKADGEHQKYGMVAQELQAVAPEAVSGDADSEEMMGVDYSKLVPMMLKEIQSLRARIEALES